MEAKRAMNVLQSFRPFLYILTIYKNGKELRNYLQMFGVSFLIFSYGIVALIVIKYCVDHNFEIGDIALQFSLLLSATQVAFNYFMITMNNGLVYQTVHLLNSAINNRA